MEKQSKLYILLSDKKPVKETGLSEDDNVQKLIDKLNLYLKKQYTGKYKFDLYTNENGIAPDDLKLTPKKKRKIKDK